MVFVGSATYQLRIPAAKVAASMGYADLKKFEKEVESNDAFRERAINAAEEYVKDNPYVLDSATPPDVEMDV